MYLSKICLITLLAAKAKSIYSYRHQDSSIGLSKPEIMSRSARNLIVGGTAVPDNASYPWMVSIKDENGVPNCGGILIDASWVLSSSLCGYIGIPTTAVVGWGDLSETFEVEYVTQHENYDAGTLENDVMLVKLKGSSTIQPATLDDGSFSVGDGTEVIALGFGFTNLEDSTYPEGLMFFDLQMIDNSACQTFFDDEYEGDFLVTENMYCTEVLSSIGTCYGDVGGPTIDQQSEVVLGIISVVGCDTYGETGQDIPEVHTRVGKYIEWIETNKVSIAPTISSAPSTVPNLEEYYLAYMNSEFNGGVDENGNIDFSTWYFTSSNIGDEFEWEHSGGEDCTGDFPAFIHEQFHHVSPADQATRQWIDSLKVIDVNMIVNDYDGKTNFCEDLIVKAPSGDVIHRVRVNSTLTAVATGEGSFTFGAEVNNIDDNQESLEIQTDATINVERCDGDRPVVQGEKICLEFTETQNEGLEVTDISELTLSFPDNLFFTYQAITVEGGVIEDLVTKDCSEGICTVEVLMVEAIFDEFPAGEASATLTGTGKALIGMVNKNNDPTASNGFEISVDLLKPDCGEEVGPLGGIFSLVRGIINRN